MQTFYRYLLIIALSLLAQAGFAQSGMLSGSLQDDKGQALPFANVAVMRTADSSLVTGTVTDGAGTFTLKSPQQGTYFLRLTAIGYKNLFSAPFTVSDEGFSKAFGSLILKEDVEVLREVTVEALRPKVVAEADKLIVSIEGTALAAGSTALDVLAKSPGVWIDHEGNIQLNGKGGVKVMIDGRPTYLSAKQLQSLLQGMSAENIKNIEVIANPTAKEDAEGTSGILNINLKKNTLSGLNGSLYAGYLYNRLNGYSGGANLNHKKGPWNSFLNLDMARRPNFREMHMLREFNQPGDWARFDQFSYEEGEEYTPSLRLGTDLDLNERHSIGTTLKLSQYTNEQDFAADMQLRRTLASGNQDIHSKTLNTDVNKTATVNLHYSGKLDSLGTRLTADLDWVRMRSEGEAAFYNTYLGAEGNPQAQEALGNTNPSAYSIYSARVDFTKPLNPKNKLELGLKASHVLSDNKLNFYTLEGALKNPIDSLSNHFIYRENILAAYSTFSSRLSDTWNVQAGLRAEHTNAKGESVSLEQTNSRRYLNLFPSLFVQQKVSDNYQISYNYSRRIQRPRYEALNPFFVYLDPYTIAQGNPQLRPEYIHSFQLTQTYKQNYNLILAYSIAKDFSTEVPVPDLETKTTVFAQRNLDRFQTFRASLVAPYQIMPKWDMFTNSLLAYQTFETVINEEPPVNSQLFFMLQSNHTVKLPKGIVLEVSGTYRGPLAHGLYQAEGAWWVDAGLKRSFLNDKLDLAMNVTDMFHSNEMNGSADIGLNHNYFNQLRSTQSLRLNLRYRFSRGEKFESKSRNSQLEELNRAGGN
ncbi:outer membrane beta-barrel family protein [Cesiribacter andamanensis]|uniref:Outer membrane receptor for ferrienterochelin and colicin n=1 Tax=Cesiribacter andamanensis AMV16 TaxID=1279009 RepID=M7MXR1_9BACT|nr:outer membrane beta-barrel family protein [Cesiribacter andamanensis]EMR01228.1 Outer membrane receptor for ferrienterochelin and colicin [Cesiribacter andamanensis AMV16]